VSIVKLLTQSISVLDLSTRTRNALLAAKIDIVGKLVALPPYNLVKQKGVEEAGLAECVYELDRRGLMLGDRRYST
jgi:DNA-directed RNA polymerase alpha subunit